MAPRDGPHEKWIKYVHIAKNDAFDLMWYTHVTFIRR